MADDDQATLGTFAADGDPASDDGPVDGAPGDPVCPWCLAPAETFVDAGLTGRACGRCSAVLPTDADWFRERDVVVRRPMYDPDSE